MGTYAGSSRMIATMVTFVVTVVSFLSSGAGAYLGSYLKKKGENLATHEDIDKLVDQVSAVTRVVARARRATCIRDLLGFAGPTGDRPWLLSRGRFPTICVCCGAV